MINSEADALDALKLARSHLEDVATYYKSTLFLYEDNDHAWAAGVALDWVNNALGYAAQRPPTHSDNVRDHADCGPLAECCGDPRDTSLRVPFTLDTLRTTDSHATASESP